jgi:hypothetical protein
MRRILSSFIAAAGVALVLSACVLSSKNPKFAIENGAVPIAADTEFDAYSRDGEGWKKENETMSFKRDGKVYLMSDGKNLASVLFVELTPEWFAAQYREGAEPYFYGLVKKAGSELEVVPLPCNRLKPLVAPAAGIAFSGNDCSIDSVTDAKALLASLITKLPEPELRLVPRQ